MIFLLLSLSHANSIYFNFSSFQLNDINITFQADAYVDSEGVQLTNNTKKKKKQISVQAKDNF